MASYFLLAANVCFAVLAAGSVQSLFPVAGFILCGYGMLILLDRIRLPGWVAVAVLVALFAYLRRYDALAMAPALPMVYSVIGLSYVLFRILHLVLERSGGTMELLWSDEFDGGKAAGCSSIDASKWDVQVGNGCQYGISGWGNDEM